jgi:hypothetical protein
MTYNTMTRWIEIADERQACEAAMFERPAAPSERQTLHLGATFLSLPSWIIGVLLSNGSAAANGLRHGR